MESVADDLLLLDSDMAASTRLAVAQGDCAVFTARCPDKASANEDAAAIIHFHDDAAVLVVADGVGGSSGGAAAAKLAIESIRDSIHQARKSEQLLRTAVIDGFENANDAIRDLGIGAATTIAAVEVNRDAQGRSAIRSYHVGDSEVFVAGNRGKVKFQTVSHSPVGYGVEAGLIETDDALQHDQRHIVSNVLGTEQMRIDIGPTFTLRPRDTVGLGSDGLFDNLRLEEIVDIVRKGPLDAAAQSLVDAVRRRMQGTESNHPTKPDDATFILYRPHSKR